MNFPALVPIQLLPYPHANGQMYMYLIASSVKIITQRVFAL